MSKHQPPELPPIAERRPNRRRRTLLGGRVTFEDGTQVFDCTIRDLSNGGARITLPERQPVPPRVFLINMRDRLVYESAIVWKRSGEAGLSFLRTLPLGELADTELDYMRKLWLERAAR